MYLYKNVRSILIKKPIWEVLELSRNVLANVTKKHYDIWIIEDTFFFNVSKSAKKAKYKILKL